MLVGSRKESRTLAESLVPLPFDGTGRLAAEPFESDWRRIMFRESFRCFFHDEDGAVISSELALVGTLGVMSIAVGLQAVSDSVTQELKNFGSTIRSTAQRYRAGDVRLTDRGRDEAALEIVGDFADPTTVNRSFSDLGQKSPTTWGKP